MAVIIPQPCLCLVTDRSVGDDNTLVSRVSDAVAGGVDLVQLREKDLPGGRLLALAESLKAAIGDRALLLINERIDVAATFGAVGVQLGEEALPVAAARQILGANAIIGRSVHSIEGASQAVDEGADFLLVGTMFTTRSHLGAAPAGPELIRRIAPSCPLPLIGIGGINANNLAQVIRAGASGVAVITSILAAPDPRGAACHLKRALTQAWDDARATRGESRVR